MTRARSLARHVARAHSTVAVSRAAAVGIAVAFALHGPVALAQEAPAAGAGALEDVLVTARKKSTAESAQDVPLAVTALSGDALETRQLTDLQAVAEGMPNVAMDELSAIKGTANFSVRGLGVNSSIPSLESTTGVFIDGIYLASTQGVMVDMFDLESVEVLRGPQGTLFGKNVTGGAVVLRSRLPSDTFEARVRVSGESGPEYKGAFSISGPLTDTLRARLSAHYGKDEGWFRNNFDGSQFGKSETIVVKPSITWAPSDDFDTTLRYEHGDISGDGSAGKNRAFYDDESYAVDQNYRGLTDLKWDSITSETNWKVPFGDGTITNVAGYREVDQDARADIDATFGDGFHIRYQIDVQQFSDELRYAGRFFDKLDLTTGLFFYTAKVSLIETRRLRSIGFVPRTFGGKQDQDTWAVFAQGDWDFTDALSLTVGGRYSRDEKDADMARFSATTNVCDEATKACTYTNPDLSDSWKSFTPKLALQYRVNDDVQTWLSWTRAYRAGGYNVRVTSPIQNLKFDQEKTTAFELGAKGDFLNRRLRTNLAIFHNKIDDMIRDVNIVNPTGAIQDTRNTADATIWGIELEAEALVTDNLRLTAFYGYQKGEYDQIRFNLRDLPGETPGVINQTDLNLRLPRLAPSSFGVGFDYTRETALGEFKARANYSHRDKAFINDANTAKLSALNNLDVGLSLGFDEGKTTVSLYGRNVLGHNYIGYTVPVAAVLIPFPVPTGRQAEYSGMSEGRVFGIEATFQFGR